MQGPVAPEADVGQERPFGQVDAQQHVRARPNRGGVRPDPRGESGHGEAQGLERRPEQRVLLEAVAAPPARDQLGLHALEVDANGPPEQDVEVLEGNGSHVALVEQAQGLGRRRQRACAADPGQVQVEIEGRHAGDAIARPCPCRSWTLARAARAAKRSGLEARDHPAPAEVSPRALEPPGGDGAVATAVSGRAMSALV